MQVFQHVLYNGRGYPAKRNSGCRKHSTKGAVKGMQSKIACGDSAIGQSKGREGGPRGSVTAVTVGRRGEFRMSLLLFSQRSMRPGHLLRTERVEGKQLDVCARALKREEEK